MQTFLPYPSFAQSAQCLDRQRLGKQRVEALQLLKALNGETKGWVNHPCVKMWKGYEECLILYGLVICQEWGNRGYKDTCLAKILAYRKDGSFTWPSWLGHKAFHDSHKSNLLRKDPVHYSQFGWDVPNNLPYVWN